MADTHRAPAPAPGVQSADRDRALALTPVSRETAGRLNQVVALLLTWQSNINLIAPSTVAAVWTRHVADSLQLLGLAPKARIWVDLGSGGGFPGLAIACALAEVPGAAMHLVESNSKKAAFLREAVRLARLPATVHAERIERFAPRFAESVDVVAARALAPLPKLLAYAEPLLERGAQGLFLKGQDVEVELTEASKYWKIEASLVPSKTSPDGRIVVVQRARRRKK
jgi:16S rRNA (guanine527-N7)-methyltransferase